MACVLPVKSVTGLFVTLFSKSESRCRKEDAGSRLRCALAMLFEAACRTFLTPTAILSVSGDILSVRDVVHKLHAIQWYVYMYVPGSTEVRREG